MTDRILIGWSQTDITPDRPVFIHGQLYVRISEYVHDPLTATCLVLDNGEEQMTFVSCDMTRIPYPLQELVVKKLNIPGFNPENLSINATHTHNSTNFGNGNTYDSLTKYLNKSIVEPLERPENLLDGTEAREYFAVRVAALIEDAWAARKPGGVSCAMDYAVIAFNRRPKFLLPDGSTETKMYGDCSRPDFVGFEGSSDHAVDVLYTWDLNNELTGVMVTVPCPSQMYELHRFLSADWWGDARSEIRERLGNIFILSVYGPAGEQNPIDLIRISKFNQQALIEWNRQAGEVLRNFDMKSENADIGDRIASAVVRASRKARNTIETRPVFRHQGVSLDLPLRTVSQDDYQEASRQIADFQAQFSPEHRACGADLTRIFEPVGVLDRWDLQQRSQIFHVYCHVLRIGRAAVATHPFELYLEFNHRIRARCKADQVFMIQLSSNREDGGYLPTQEAIGGGSYSSKPASTLVGPQSGAVYVETVIRTIDRLFT